MRLSCNGCRVLRKGCSEDCSIRPCLQWIKSPEAQANAIVFLAKFYGRAGLMNLVNAAPADAHRPGIFRSLLYEACGRIVNPIYGSVGLLWSNNWHMCQAAVEAVLAGKPVVQVSSEDAAAADRTPPLRAYDIRHVSKLDDGLARSPRPDAPASSAPPPPPPTTSRPSRVQRRWRSRIDMKTKSRKRRSSSSVPRATSRPAATTTTTSAWAGRPSWRRNARTRRRWTRTPRRGRTSARRSSRARRRPQPQRPRRRSRRRSSCSSSSSRLASLPSRRGPLDAARVAGGRGAGVPGAPVPLGS